MDRNLPTLKECPLFEKIGETEILMLLHCLNAHEQYYHAGEIILPAKSASACMGVLLSGTAITFQVGADMPRKLQVHHAGDAFGLVFFSTKTCDQPIRIYAKEYCRVLLLDMRKISYVCPTSCSFHMQLINNLFAFAANQAFDLLKKVDLLEQRSIRSRLLTYLSWQRPQENGAILAPHNRNEMAEFLGIDRSALSRELSKMQEEGILRFSRNEFWLLNPSQIETA